jgi:hypothetical protein
MGHPLGQYTPSGQNGRKGRKILWGDIHGQNELWVNSQWFKRIFDFAVWNNIGYQDKRGS